MASRLTHQVDIKLPCVNSPCRVCQILPQNILSPSFPPDFGILLPCFHASFKMFLPCFHAPFHKRFSRASTHGGTCRGGRKRMLHLPPKFSYLQKLNTSVSQHPSSDISLHELAACPPARTSTTTEATISTKRAIGQKAKAVG